LQEIMDESDATIQELAERVKSLEVDTSDLARRNALLEKVAELRRDALPRASGGGASDTQVKCLGWF
jgi:predicted nuclease with TOPRIM domain